MEYSVEEIEYYFNLYPIALKKVAEIKEYTNYSILQTDKKEELILLQNFYSVIIKSVDQWLNSLSEEEVKILQTRFFRHCTYEEIAFIFYYENRSSVRKKIKSILKKIEKGANK